MNRRTGFAAYAAVLLFAPLLCVCSLTSALAQPIPLLDRLKAQVAELASDADEGRLTGSAGEHRAADYLISELKRIGARPLPGLADYREPFQFTAGAHDGGSSITVLSTRLGEISFESRPDVLALSLSEDGAVTGPVVFAGYGIVVPESQGVPYDSYASLDVKDKIVLVLRYFPEKADGKTRAVLARYADLRFKALAARQHGAKALLVVTGPRSPNAGQTIPMGFDTALAGSGIVAASISEAVARTLFVDSGRNLEAAQSAIDAGDPRVAGFELPRMTAQVRTAVVRETRTAGNVLAYLPATVNSGAANSGAANSADKSWLALGAHYDHLGRGEGGNSLAGKDEAGRIHHGADDNASGAAALLAIAETLAAQPRGRNILFAFWSGEEFGLLGSKAFMNRPPIPPAGLLAYLNFDMVGRLQDNTLIVQATGTSSVWPRLLEQANVAAGFDLALQEDPYQPTDVASFNEAGVPSLNFFTGAHADYHRPSDTADKIDYEGLERIAAFGAAIARRLAGLDKAPDFVRVAERSSNRPSRAGVRLFTGTIPDYASSAKGLLLSGVVGGGPADQAGLQKGDLIVELAGQAIANIYDYTYALEQLKPGVPARVVYLRGGERRETSLTPSVRN